ncbi:hypothetical protein G5C51_27415 [Streptomyces sp. A7024]|uniref:Uncharacterized protein n=1 Tax=Streptomyces coryli TaxID=1128680 RepID=A0A6G4U5V6_9ACTN|nr:hypothetical protein [Streptomyces coryli]NGN67619.1 hypothetical protein [Streptomyces coryli]
MRDSAQTAVIAVSAVAGLAAGATVLVPGIHAIRTEGGSAWNMSFSHVGGMVVVAAPLIVIMLLLPRLFMDAQGVISRRNLFRYRVALVILFFAAEVPIFSYVVPGIVGLGAPDGYTWSAVLGCLFGALGVGVGVGALTWWLLIVIVEHVRDGGPPDQS